MKARDFIQTLEYMKSFKEAKETKRRRKTRPPENMALLLSRLSAADLLNMLADKERDAQILSNYLKDKEKINKKDEQKKDGWNLQQVQTFLIFIAIIAPFYAKWLFH